MRYKLVFSRNNSDSFYVVASAVGVSTQPVVGHYKNDEAFLRLMQRANLAPDEYARLVYATMLAVALPETPASEEVSLDMQQLNLLQLNVSHQQVA